MYTNMKRSTQWRNQIKDPIVMTSAVKTEYSGFTFKDRGSNGFDE